MDEPLSPGMYFAEYRIHRLLGRGGMGSVYLADHPRLPRRTALKILDRASSFDHEIRARFEREADVVAQLDHTNIVTIFDRGVEQEQMWLSMQYIEGGDASALPQPSVAEALRIVTETAKALDYAHSFGVLHRDVKPANILISRGTTANRVYLTDFGIARFNQDANDLTRTGTITATLAYASPEQLCSSPLDHRSDQYSLACTLFRLLTGTTPFEAPSAAAVIQGHLMAAPPTVSSLRPEVPAMLNPVLAKAMAKQPEDRYGSCLEFVSDAARAIETNAPIGEFGYRTPAPMRQPLPLPIGPPPQALPSRGAGPEVGKKKSRLPIAFGIGIAVMAVIVGTGFVVLPGLFDTSDDSGQVAMTSAAPTSTTGPVRTKPTKTESYWQPPPQHNKYTTEGRPEIAFDPCTWISDDTVQRAGFRPFTRSRKEDVIAESSFLGCRFSTESSELVVKSGNRTWNEDLEEVGSYSRPIRIGSREALRVDNPDINSVCEVDVRTKVGYVTISVAHYRLYGKPADCSNIERIASVIEPEIGAEN